MTKENPMTIKLTRGELRGLLKVAGKSDVRYYLNGICADFDKGSLFVTNGHAMLWHNPVIMTGSGRVVLPRSLLEPLTKGGKSALHHELEIRIRGENITVADPENKTGSIQVSGQALDARFPDVGQIIPNQLSGEPAHFDPQLVATVHSALQDIEGRSNAIDMRLHHNGQSAALAAFHDHYAVIMPIRENKPAAADLAAARESFGLDQPADDETAEPESKPTA